LAAALTRRGSSASCRPSAKTACASLSIVPQVAAGG
jgi:hypothetical protein